MPASTTSLTQEINTLLENAIRNGVAPGLQCVVFNRDQILFNNATGFATLPTDIAPAGKPMTPSTIFWTASCTKLVTSLVTLHIIERGLTKTGFTMADLDNHEKLVEVLPEFKGGEGNLLSKILEGFEDAVDSDGKRVLKLREAKNKVTLRMLLTHTAGIDNGWHKPLAKELYKPTDGSVPHKGIHFFSGKVDDLVLPLICEPGTECLYSLATAWVGVFAERATGKALPTLFREIVFEPLGVPRSDAGLWLPSESSSRISSVHQKNLTTPAGSKLAERFMPIPFGQYLPPSEDVVEDGKIALGDGGMLSTCEAFSKVLQAVLKEDPRILSTEHWKMATKDDLKERGMSVPYPEWDLPDGGSNIVMRMLEYAKSTDPSKGAGASLLSCRVARAPTVTGRPKDSFGWSGATNIYYFIDQENGLGGIIGGQFFPFYDTEMIELRDEFEKVIYKHLQSDQL